MNKERRRALLWRLPLLTMVITAAFWGVWYMVTESVPTISSFQFTVGRAVQLPLWVGVLTLIFTSNIITEDKEQIIGLTLGLCFGLIAELIVELSYWWGYELGIWLVIGLSFGLALGLVLRLVSKPLGLSFLLGYGLGFVLIFELIYGPVAGLCFGLFLLVIILSIWSLELFLVTTFRAVTSKKSWQTITNWITAADKE